MLLSNRSRAHASFVPFVNGTSLGARWRRLVASRTLHFLCLALVMTALSFGLRAWKLPVGSYLDSYALDGYFKSRGEASAPDVSERLPGTRDIILVETTHQLPRPILARLLYQLRQARVVTFDMMFVDEERLLQPDDLTPEQKTQWYGSEIRLWRHEDALLANAIRRHGRVVLGTWPDEMRSRSLVAPSVSQSNWAPNNANLESSTRFEQIASGEAASGEAASGKTTGGASDDKTLTWQKPSRALWDAAGNHAHLLVDPDLQDSVVREVRLYDGPPNARQPALGLALAAASLGVSPRELKAQVARMNPQGGVLQLGSKQIPYGPAGVISIDFSGGRTSFESNSLKYKRVLDEFSEPEDFKDKIVIIGEASETSKEIMNTPFGAMPGMQIHANVAATLLETSSPLQPLDPIWIAVLALCGSLLLVAPLLRFSLWTSFVAGLIQCAILFWMGVWIFVHFRRILPLSVPVFAMLLTLNGLALYEYRRARATLGAFIGTEMLPHALSLFAQLRLGGKTEEATAWFCDLRGYSSLSEHMTAQEVSGLLAQYTETIVRIVQRHGGRPIDYQGDGVFVLFESSKPDFCQRAVLAALETEAAFHTLHDQWRHDQQHQDRQHNNREQDGQGGTLPLEIAIGMATGPLMIGLVGSHRHLKMGAVGDAVNVASRAQALSRECGFPILLSRSTYARVLDLFPLQFCGEFHVHGRTQPIELYGLSWASLQHAAAEADETRTDKMLHHINA